jgi:hypothetical protein
LRIKGTFESIQLNLSIIAFFSGDILRVELNPPKFLSLTFLHKRIVADYRFITIKSTKDLDSNFFFFDFLYQIDNDSANTQKLKPQTNHRYF